MTSTHDFPALSLVRGDLLFRLQRAAGLIPAGGGLGIVRRALCYALFAWLPVALWALWKGRVVEGGLDEPVLEHFGVHVRCLVAIPLLVFAEATFHGVTQRLLPQFVQGGFLADRAGLDAVVRDVARLRDRTLPWVIILGLVVAWTLLGRAQEVHEVRWAVEDSSRPDLGFGGWWYLFVARPIYVMLVLTWLWRVVLLTVLLRRLAALSLSLVPTHPDRHAGLGFLKALPSAFWPVVLALAAVASGIFGHDVVYHAAPIASLKVPAVGFLVIVAVIFVAPLLVFTPVLARLKRRALSDYAALIAEHGRAVHARWIEHRPAADNPLLAAPEIGPVADTAAIYDAVKRMGIVLVSTRSVAALVLPAVIPMLVVVALKVPVKAILLTILKLLT